MRGRVVDAEQKVGLPGAAIALLGTEFGAHADERGYFHLKGLPPGRYDVLVSFIGYRSLKLEGVEAGTGEELEIALYPSAIELPDMVVSATRRTQSFAEAPVSMSVISAPQIAAYNTFSISGPLNEVSGVSMVGSQVNIRGSSGYSRGTGSRVLLLLDGFPMLSADLGDIKWDAIPVGEVERVEVLKGAGSALYGTGALGGVINVITRPPDDEPRTGFRLISGLYSQPAYRSWRWTDDPMYLAGVDLSHSRRLGQTGLRVAIGHQRGTGYQENDDFLRYRAYAKAVHHFAAGTYWRTLVNWAIDDHGVVVQWKDRQEPLRVPEGDQDASTVSWKLNLNNEFYHLQGRSLGYRLKTYYYRTGFENSAAAGELASAGHKLGGEVQVDYTGREKMDLTVGVAGAWDVVRAPADFLGRRRLLNLGLYTQTVYQLLPQAEVSAGLRYDLHHRDRYREGEQEGGDCPVPEGEIRRTEQQLSPQLGLSYRPAAGTALRASAGLGFRAPSVSEIYTQAEVSGLMVCPNPTLRAERSRSFEVGLKQQFGNWVALDLALFWNDYEGLVEGRSDPSLGGNTPMASFRNISEARIRGLEIEQLVALPFGLRWQANYTFLDPVELLSADELLLPPYCRAGLEPGEEAPLPYRARHLLNLGLTAFRKTGRAGVSFQYISRFERVSGLFSDCRRDHIPVYLVDGYLARRLGALEFNFRIDNLFQYHYVLTERKIRGPRQFTLSVAGVL